MKLQKKAVLYLFFAVIFVALFGVVFLTQNAYTTQDKQQLIVSRGHTMNDFVTDINTDLDRAAFISGFRALIGIEEYISYEGTFFDNLTSLEEAFKEAFVAGSVNGFSLGILDNSSFDEYLQKVSDQADSIGIDVNITITNITLEHTSPWVILVTFNSVFYIADKQSLMWWNYTQLFETEVAIKGIKDPLYTVNTLGRVPNTIGNYTLPASGYVNESNNDTTALKEFVEGSYYRASNEAPSFLQRFINNLSANEHGIESIVYLPTLSDQGIIVFSDRSVVDHIYFSSSPDNSTDRCQIDEMIYTPDWFRLDQDHIDDYELSGLNSQPCS